MSDHVADRLSAFLDRELTEAEASGVRLHLGECERCATRLGELQDVDRAFAAALPEAPAEYFDSFAGRVRTRIEGAQAAPKTDRPFRLPSWSWAVAAALLLGVLLPRLPWDAQPQPKAAAELAAPPSLGPMRAEESAPATLDEKLDAPAQVAVVRPDDTRRTLMLPASPARPSSPAAPPATAATPAPGFAQGPAAELSLRQPAAAPPRSPATAPLEKERESDRFAEANREAQAMVLADAELRSRDKGEAKALGAAAEASATTAEEAAGAKDEAARPSLSAPAPAASGRVAADALARDRADQSKRRPAVSEKAGADAVEGAPGSRGQDAGGAEFETLAARQARTPQELRELREALRSLLTRHPSHPEADEVRVLVVAASVELSARTGAAEDRAEARRGAQAYLRRPDAAQKERVSALLRRLDP